MRRKRYSIDTPGTVDNIVGLDLCLKVLTEHGNPFTLTINVEQK